MSLKRVSKKLVRNLDDIDAAIIVCNVYDPQLATLAAFYDAVDEIPQFTVLNKTDMVTGEQVLGTTSKLPGEVIPASLAGVSRGVAEIKYRLDRWVQGEAGVRRVAVLGVFNAGKTSLINSLTNENNPVDDIPGTTVIFSEHPYKSLVLIDSVGQLIDVNKPQMVSMDFSDCKTREQKIAKCFTSSVDALVNTLPVAVEPILGAVNMIRAMVDRGGKLITCGAGASALVAEEIAGQAQETGLPVLVATNNFASAQPVSFAKGAFEDEYALADYFGRMVNPNDIALGVSASGGTGFVFEFLRIAKEKGAQTVAITENSDTPLGKNADIIIKSDAKPEGPSSSKVQVAHLVIGYALILTVADERGIDAGTAINYMLPQKCRNKKMGIK